MEPLNSSAMILQSSMLQSKTESLNVGQVGILCGDI